MDDNKSIISDIKAFLQTNYRLRYNCITRNIENNGEPVNDRDLNSIYISCRAKCKKATKELVFSVLFSDSTESYNPFIAFIEANKDDTLIDDNIKQLIASIETETANYDLFIRKWLCAMIASIHGHHSPLMLVLCGGQNTGKTEWFRRLLPAALSYYYAESKLDGGKDDEILMTKKLIVMDDEMGGKSKQENKKLKEMTSKQTFSLREPYGRVSVDLVRL
ncbi:MAG TPA: VapE domain-containing protein, partial [Mucilaginibacter sp.]|nr:VapE domain-containing protein [Mucilaginibacter sp.]